MITSPPPAQLRAEVYEVIRSDADIEAQITYLSNLLPQQAPRTVLDAGCGPGTHLARFGPEFDVEGFDIDDEMVRLASVRAGGRAVQVGDIRSFSSEKKYSLVCSLFNPIAYLSSTDDLDAAIASMAGCLDNGGLMVVEPFLQPGAARERDHPSVKRFTTNGMTGSRVTHGRLVDEKTLEFAMRFVCTSMETVFTWDEVHTLSLWSWEDLEGSFERAGLTFSVLDDAPFRGGLAAGRRE